MQSVNETCYENYSDDLPILIGTLVIEAEREEFIRSFQLPQHNARTPLDFENLELSPAR